MFISVILVTNGHGYEKLLAYQLNMEIIARNKISDFHLLHLQNNVSTRTRTCLSDYLYLAHEVRLSIYAIQMLSTNTMVGAKIYAGGQYTNKRHFGVPSVNS